MIRLTVFLFFCLFSFLSMGMDCTTFDMGGGNSITVCADEVITCFEIDGVYTCKGE